MKGVWLGIRGIFQRNNPQATLARKPYKDNIDIYFVSMCRYNTWYTRTNVYAFNIHTIKNDIDICTYMSVIYIHILEERKAYKKTWCVSPFDVWSQSSWCQNSRREHGWHPRSPFSISHVWVANDCLNVSWWSRGRRILLCQPTPPASSALSSSLSETFKGATSGRLSTGERQEARHKWWTSWTMVATLSGGLKLWGVVQEGLIISHNLTTIESSNSKTTFYHIKSESKVQGTSLEFSHEF